MDKNLRLVRRALGALVAAALVVPGFSAPAVAKGRAGSEKAEPRVVVAVIDTGFNAFHEYFYKGGPLYGNRAPSSVTPAVLKEFGIGKDQIIKVPRTGNFGEDFAKVKAQFDDIEKGEPYWFAGTNVIGVSFLGDKQRLRPDGGASTHGIGTAASVLTANPQAIVVGGDMARTFEPLLAGIRESVYAGAVTLASRDLRILPTSHGELTGVVGAANLVLAQVLSADAVDDILVR